ncbi:hypothetical protein KY495_04410 [Massilia sp. PAMC28688]|uniref:hypothetical protein n=1 Tax=Massilia sp. PAMC28688 TaxID=2861283 RepID=UPI001C63842C|nr:hypothetical protein [Massilia sp. PAMC28688]QYF94465.1 hypothetical protein KY495_04410 [Massilia sp. PAMC28688]
MTALAALLFTVLAAAVVLFQLALVWGAPYGALTLGGTYKGALPLPVRVVPALSAILLAAFAMVVLIRADLVLPQWALQARSLIWLVIAYCAVGVAANFFTPSRRERTLWLPVVSLMLVSSAITAFA